eukprot:11342996-Heterocapsa_arctica.AAC.1
MSIASEGFGNYDTFYPRTGEVQQTDNDHRKPWLAIDYDTAGAIRDGRRVLFKPLVGLFNQDKLLPIRHMPIQIELELVSNKLDAIAAAQQYDNKDWTSSDAQ